MWSFEKKRRGRGIYIEKQLGVSRRIRVTFGFKMPKEYYKKVRVFLFWEVAGDRSQPCYFPTTPIRFGLSTTLYVSLSTFNSYGPTCYSKHMFPWSSDFMTFILVSHINGLRRCLRSYYSLMLLLLYTP